MQSKCETRQGGEEHWAGGEKKKADAAKKKIFKERDGVENPGDGAAGALVFLGINVTELLLDKGRHREALSSRERLSFFIYLLSFTFFLTSFFLSKNVEMDQGQNI